VGLAIAAGMGALMDAAGMGIPAEGVSLAPRTIVVGLLCGVLTTLLAALVPAVRGTRVAPVAAITGATTAAPGARRLAPWLAGAAVCGGVAALLAGLLSDGAATSRMTAMGSGAVLLFVGIAAGARWLVRPVASVVGRPVERLFGVAGQLARENAMRNPARTATTAAALMVGLGMVVFVAVFAAGLKASVNGSLDAVIRADYIVQARGVEPLPAGAGAAVASVPDVRATSPIAFDQVQVNGRAVQASTDTVEGIDPRTIDAVYRFRWIGAPAVSPAALRPGQALIEQQFAKAHDLRVGSMFSVRTSSGRSARLVAVGEYDDPQILQGLMVSGDQFRRLSTLRDPYLYLIASAPGASAPVMHRALDRALGAFPTAEVRSNAEYRQDVEDQLDQMANMLYALLAMSVVIAVFGIANNLFLSVYERTREIGLLRAMGATGTQVRRVIRYESVITATIGGLLGIGVGLLLAWLMVQALRDLGFGYAVPVGQLVVFLLVAIGVGVAAAVAPARRGAHIDVLQALRHE
jgi:putative ABC transport system permease protein